MEVELRAQLANAQAQILELRTALKKFKCRLCDGSGKTWGDCDDPHCGESYWEHNCGKDEEVKCEPCDGTGEHPDVRAVLARITDPMLPEVPQDRWNAFERETEARRDAQWVYKLKSSQKFEYPLADHIMREAVRGFGLKCVREGMITGWDSGEEVPAAIVDAVLRGEE